MDLRELLLMQLEREAGAARKVVERVPEGKNDWKPHEKSMNLGYLAALGFDAGLGRVHDQP